MKTFLWVAALAPVIWAQALAADRPVRLLAANNNDCRTIPTCDVSDPLHLKGILLEIDPATGAGTAQGVIANSTPSLAFSARTGELFASLTVLPAPAESHLNILDPDTGATSFVGVIRDAGDESIEYSVAAMAFSEEGTLYGIDRRSNSLLVMDTETALAAPVGAGLGFNVRGNGGTIHDGVFYLLSGSRRFEIELYTVDLASGLAFFVGLTGIQDSGIGLAARPNGSLLGVINDKLYEIDGLSGPATLIGAIGTLQVSSLVFVDELALRCPCDVRADGWPWKNQGQYQRCIAAAVSELRADGTISPAEQGELVATAARSSCGR